MLFAATNTTHQCSNSSTGSNTISSSFTIRRGHKIQPNPSDDGLLKVNNTSVGSSSGVARPAPCEKINTSSQPILRKSSAATLDTSHIDNTTMDHGVSVPSSAPVFSITTSVAASTCSLPAAPVVVVPDHADTSEGRLRTDKAEPTECSSSSAPFDSEDITESSYDGVGAPALIEEDDGEGDDQPATKFPTSCQVPLSALSSSSSSPKSSSLPSSPKSVSLPPRPPRPSKPASKLSRSIRKSSLKSSSSFDGTAANKNHRIKQSPLGRPSTERRVRGLWNESINRNCHWNKLRDETVVKIVDFLNLADTLKVSMLAKRYRSLVHSNKSLWRSVDATEFVHTAHTTFSRVSSSSTATATATATTATAQEQTGKTLQTIMERYNPISLVIRDIHTRLSADTFLPSVASLQELTLDHFEDLSDTHAHVLLLMTQAGAVAAAANKKKSNSLRKLALNHCPLLTSASLRSIVSQCPSLEALNLEGCVGIHSLEPLASLLVTESKPLSTMLGVKPTPPKPSLLLNMFGPPASQPAPAPSSQATTGLLNMFGPPPPTKPAPTPPQASMLSSMFGPPPPSNITATQVPPSPARPVTPPVSPTRVSSPHPASSLQSLFAPPGMSPPRKQAPSVPSLPAMSGKGLSLMASSSGGGSSNISNLSLPSMGKLQDLNLQATGIRPPAVLKLFQTASDGNTMVEVALRSLKLEGQYWTDHHLDQLSPLISWSHLKELSFAVSSHDHHYHQGSSSSSSLSDTALEKWASQARFSRLTSLDLSGHVGLTAQGLSKLLPQTPKLQTLCCQGLPHLLTAETIGTSPLLKRLKHMVERKQLCRVDFRHCQFEPLVHELIQSTLNTNSKQHKNKTNNINSRHRYPVQLLL